MTYEEALQALNCGMLDLSDVEPYLGVIRQALEKQIPEKPLKERTEFSKFGYYNYCCPTCNRPSPDKCCPYCGQAIDWSDCR